MRVSWLCGPGIGFLSFIRGTAEYGGEDWVTLEGMIFINNREGHVG